MGDQQGGAQGPAGDSRSRPRRAVRVRRPGNTRGGRQGPGQHPLDHRDTEHGCPDKPIWSCKPNRNRAAGWERE